MGVSKIVNSYSTGVEVSKEYSLYWNLDTTYNVATQYLYKLCHLDYYYFYIYFSLINQSTLYLLYYIRIYYIYSTTLL